MISEQKIYSADAFSIINLKLFWDSIKVSIKNAEGSLMALLWVDREDRPQLGRALWP